MGHTQRDPPHKPLCPSSFYREAETTRDELLPCLISHMEPLPAESTQSCARLSWPLPPLFFFPDSPPNKGGHSYPLWLKPPQRNTIPVQERTGWYQGYDLILVTVGMNPDCSRNSLMA